MGEGRAGRLRERWDARDERDARRGRGGSRARSGAGDAGGSRIVARRAALGTTPPRGGRAARRGAAGTDRARVGAGGRAHMAVRDDERVVGGARGVPRPGDDGRGAARGGSDRRAAARERAPRGAQRERQRRRGRGGHRRARARRTCAFARGKPRVVLVRAMHRDAAGSAEKDERGDAGRTAKSCECLEKAVFHRWAPLPDSVTKPSRGKKRPGLRLSPGVRTRRSRPVGKSDCRRRGEHAVVVRARRGGHTSAHAALATPRPPQTPPRRRERPAAPSRPHAPRASRTGRSHSPRRPRGFRRPTLRASRIRVASAPRSRRARCPRATPRCGSSRRARSARTPPPPRSAASSEGTRRAPTATRPNALARASPADVFAAAGRRFGPTFVPAPQPSFYVTSS